MARAGLPSADHAVSLQEIGDPGLAAAQALHNLIHAKSYSSFRIITSHAASVARRVIVYKLTTLLDAQVIPPRALEAEDSPGDRNLWSVCTFTILTNVVSITARED